MLATTRRALALLALLAGAGGLSAESAGQLKAVLAARLSVMKDVAAHKWMHDLPIEDAKREAAVLKATVDQAKQRGVDVEFADEVVSAQIDAAKRIQARWFNHWRTAGGPSSAPDLVTEIRPRISELTAELIGLVTVLQAQPLSAAEQVELRRVPRSLADDEAAWWVAMAPFVE